MNELIRRATPGLALAGAALATVWIFDPALHSEASTRAASATAEGSATGPTSSGDSGPTAGSGTSGDSGPTADSGTSGDSGTAGDSGSASSSGDSSASDTTTSDQAGDCSDPTSVTGDAVMTRWGPVQVRMDFAAEGSVCAVQALVYPNGDHHSARLNDMAIPYLDSEAAAVGVAFDGVSGATYTSEAYRQSMQSILDQQ